MPIIEDADEDQEMPFAREASPTKFRPNPNNVKLPAQSLTLIATEYSHGLEKIAEEDEEVNMTVLSKKSQKSHKSKESHTKSDDHQPVLDFSEEPDILRGKAPGDLTKD